MNKKWIIISLIVAALIVSIALAFTLLKPNDTPEIPTPPASSEVEQPPESSIPDWHTPPEEDPYMEEPGSYEADDPDLDTSIGDIPYKEKGEEVEYVPEVKTYTDSNTITYKLPEGFGNGGETIE